MDLMELLRTRRTYRRFDQTRKVPQEVVGDILKAQQLASCANNRQHLRYIVVQTPELVEKIFSLTLWAASLPPEEGMPKPGEHPTMFVVVMADKSAENMWTATDAGLAISNMTLAAWQHGVGSCIIANVQRKPLIELLQIPDNFYVHTVLAFGYPTHLSHIREVGKGEDVTYYLDENRDYVVPRRKIEDVVTYR